MKFRNDKIPSIDIIKEDSVKFKILSIDERYLENELESQYKIGFEPLEFLYKINPSSNSDFNGWKILFRSIRK